MTPVRGLIAALLVALALAAATTIAGGNSDPAAAPSGAPAKGEDDVVLTPDAVDQKAVRRVRESKQAPKAQVVELSGAGQPKTYEGSDGVSPGAPSDAEVKAELKEARAQLAKFKRFLGTSAFAQTGPRARILPDGTAVAPEDAPEPVQKVIQAGNAIAKMPYKWGGGHGAWRDNGYDCSGSVSFALAGAGLLDAPMASGGFMNWGAPGPGKWITIHAGPGHMYMVVAGLRFDTSGAKGAGTRWQPESRGMGGLEVRHIPGL